MDRSGSRVVITPATDCACVTANFPVATIPASHPGENLMKKLALASTTVALVGLLFVVAGLQSQEGEETQKATGVVFHDANGNRQFDSGEKPLAGIRVSNGGEIVTTDKEGRYTIGISDDTLIFVVKPRDWRTPLSKNNTPEFYYNHKPKGSPPLTFAGVAATGALPKSVDFPLYPQDEPKEFKTLMFGDPQPRDQKEVDWIAHDVIEELVGTDASFGVTLGDIVFDDLNMFESQARSIALLGIPWYNVVGNHDINYDAKNDRMSDETFERHFGPAYYSFEYGPVHFIVLDDIEWTVADGAEKGHYTGGLGKRQMEFVKNDLELVPNEQMVVLMMHIPLVNVRDRQELYRLIEKRKFCISISGHTHHHEHRLITKEDGWMGAEPHHHIINVTVCGSWWSGSLDERGIPHTQMADGAPNGYSILSFNGTEYDLQFKAAGRPADYQMQLFSPEVVAAADTTETLVYVNVFNGGTRSTVEMRVGGEWAAMTHTREVDPLLQQVYDRELAVNEKPAPWRQISKPKASTHLWKLPLPEDLQPGSHLIEVRTTDMFGKSFQSRRIIRVE